MLKDAYIDELRVGDEFEGFFVLKSAQSRRSANGKPFLNAVIADCSGELEAKVWDYAGPIGPADAGSAIKVRGTASEFRGAIQATIGKLRLATEQDQVDRAKLVPTAPIDADAAMEELRGLAASIEDPDYRAVCEAMLDRHGEALRSLPAGKSVHHSFVSGLLMHTLNMARLADGLSGLYYDTVDRSLLLAGTILHDLAKEREFSVSSLGLVTDYSVPGQLLGHLVMGAQEVADTARELGTPEDKSILLQHMLLSHHGKPETGAAVLPLTAEAELLSYIDLIDSRMEIYREHFDRMEPGTFSERIFALEKRIYRHF
ncbi:MAG: HD domain-containing protein [Oscillospiraceae bacterium]|nr:HD domain-containing protein [Oscillospiraceae bacterium]